MKKILIILLIIIISLSAFLLGSSQQKGYSLIDGGEIAFKVPNGDKITFEICDSAYAHVVLYDVGGNIVDTLAKGIQGPSTFEVDYDFSDLNSGIYFYVIHTRKIEKIVIMK
jgi:hypothetical protein